MKQRTAFKFKPLPKVLLNASMHTNFIYTWAGTPLSGGLINAFNAAHSFKDKFKTLASANGSFQYAGTETSVFKNNLTLVDSLLPQILGSLLKYYYAEGVSNISALCSLLNQRNPLKYDLQHNHQFYAYKIKRFLTEVTLGLMPSKMWTGKYDATGGYLVVKEDGEVLCYHVYNRNDFEEHLYQNTKLDTPSTSRYSIGQIYTEAGVQKLKLNLQIRFTG